VTFGGFISVSLPRRTSAWDIAPVRPGFALGLLRGNGRQAHLNLLSQRADLFGDGRPLLFEVDQSPTLFQQESTDGCRKVRQCVEECAYA